jgi:hypothetical protein
MPLTWSSYKDLEYRPSVGLASGTQVKLLKAQCYIDIYRYIGTCKYKYYIMWILTLFEAILLSKLIIASDCNY